MLMKAIIGRISTKEHRHVALMIVVNHALKKLRSKVPQFECFLCGEPAISEARHPDRDRIKLVEMMEIRTTSLKASERVSSSLTDEIRAMLLDCHDLVAVEARYHPRCYQKLLLANPSVNSDKAGRPVDENKQDSFLLLCSWLESEGMQKSSRSKMGELACEGSEIYSEKSYGFGYARFLYSRCLISSRISFAAATIMRLLSSN
ncbi:hypothetical protein SNE40_004273 [Patella caerulea]|uniref:Uncharacterized protein n=1 Tax=Patella caerulea TaxID=87958 RepID=A0AAN8QGH6_PATCE